MADTKRQLLEGLYTAHRIAELRRNPVRGHFDLAHLKEIHRRIFQDLPGAGFPEVAPGEFRPAVPAGNDWMKTRRLETVRVPSHVAYSAMDAAAIERLARVLAGANPSKLAQLKTAEFTQDLGELYVEADYIHAFGDGNSRTLREFTHQLAREAGYDLDWTQFAQVTAGRDVLYIARDLSVNRLALPHLRHDGTKRDVITSMDQLEGNRELPDLLRDVVRPARAVAFERLPEHEAMKAHPELGKAFTMVHLAQAYFAAKAPQQPELQAAGMQRILRDVQARLDAGETRGFSQGWSKGAVGQGRTKDGPER